MADEFSNDALPPDVTRQAFERCEPGMRALPASDLLSNTAPPGRIADAVIRGAQALKLHRPTFELNLTPRCFDCPAFEDLEDRGRAIIHVQGRQRARDPGVAELRTDAQKARTDLFRRARRAAADDPAMTARLRGFASFQVGVSQGQDMTQLGTFLQDNWGFFGRWPNLDADRVKAVIEMGRTLTALPLVTGDDLLARAITYAHVPAMRVWRTAQFLFAEEPRILAQFPQPGLSVGAYPSNRRRTPKATPAPAKPTAETKPAETKPTEPKPG